MESRYPMGRNYLYHQIQSTGLPRENPSAAPPPCYIPHRLLPGVTLPPELIEGNHSWLHASRMLLVHLLPVTLHPLLLMTLSSYDRLSIALTVAQTCGVSHVCRYYAARLALQPGPEASRASNQRLTQLTEFARLLARHPVTITAHFRKLLRKAGLTERDIVHLVLISATVSFQARLVAVAAAVTQAVQPAVSIFPPPFQDDGRRLTPGRRWRADVHPTACCERVSAVDISEGAIPALRPLRPMLRALCWDTKAVGALCRLYAGLSDASRDLSIAWPPELVAFSVHGSASCLNTLLRARWYTPEWIAALRGGQAGLEQWVKRHPQDRAWITVLRLLACAPDHITPGTLAAVIQNRGPSFLFLARAACASGFCRLKLGLGDSG